MNEYDAGGEVRKWTKNTLQRTAGNCGFSVRKEGVGPLRNHETANVVDVPQ